MATNILMPALSPTMTEGTLARWIKKEGDAIRSGDVIAEIETDKATMEVEAADDGILGKILVPDGTQGVKVNEPIATLREGSGTDEDEDEDVPSEPHPAAAAKAPAPSPQAERAASPPSSERPAAAKPNGHDAPRVAASPLAKRMALQAGVDLSGLKGSGPGGRIVKADIIAVSGTKTAEPAEIQAAEPAEKPAQLPPKLAVPAIAEPHSLTPHSTMRKTIARRLTEAKQTVPHFYVSMDVELDALLELRAKLNARAPAEGQGVFKLSVNDMLIKAAAVALRRVPGVNAAWTEDGIARFENVDISIAVSIPDGLITPIIRNADQKGLVAISREMKDLAERARGGKLKPGEFQGGSFSISNMGMYGVSEFAAIINPPQAAILAIAAGIKRPVVRDNALAIATVATCTLSVDHRVVDGALGAEWLAAFKAIAEDPLNLML